MMTSARARMLLLSLSLCGCETLLDEGLSLPTSEPETSPTPTPTANTTRWVFSGELDNARDLGGVPLADGATTAYGMVFRGTPLELSAEGCTEFADLGIRTVIDLRSAQERTQAPDADCAQASAPVVLAPLNASWNYQSYITGEPGVDAVLQTFAVLADEDAYPVYVHCSFGRDRSGVISALILGALGASRAEIEKEYKLSSASVGAYPALLGDVLDMLESVGGTESFLAQTGVTTEQLETLRDLVIVH